MATIEHSEKSALSRYDLSWDSWLTRVYALNWEVAIYALILVIALVSRFYDLGERVMSHDESLHTYYSWRLYDAGDFQHTPLMHGPLLFHVTAFFYFLFGDNDYTARIYPALLGVLITMFPLLFRRWLGRIGAILASVGLLISPMLLYYNRYIRHDTPAMFFALVMIYAFMQYIDGKAPRRPVWMWVFSGAMLLMLASKEVAFIYIAIFGSFLTVYWVLRLLQEIPLQHRLSFDKSWRPPALQRVFGHILVYITATVLANLGGEALAIWQHTRMDWLWVIIGVVLVLFVRVIPLLWELLQKDRRGDGLSLLFASIILIGILIFLVGTFNFRNYNSQLSAFDQSIEEGGLIATQGADRPVLESNRNTAAGVMAGGFLVSLLGFAGMILYTRQSAQDEDAAPVLINNAWIINTVLTMGVAWLILALLKLVTLFDADSAIWFQALVFWVVFIGFESVGFVRTFMAGESRPGIAQMFTEGLARGKSAGMLIMGGTILGVALAIYVFSALDVIKPDQVWQRPEQAEESTATEEAISVPEQDAEITVDTRLGNALLMWLLIPTLGVILLVFAVAVIKTPLSMPLPWSDILIVLLVAAMVCGVMVSIERRSHLEKEDESSEPVAIDPNEESTAEAPDDYDRTLIYATLLVMLGLSGAVAAWRIYLPQTWDYLNRQPAFDVLIVMGTMILPWISAYPIFLAGYKMDPALPADTRNISILVTGSFLLLSAVIGLSWNWRVWLVSNVVFLSLFVFFFTTVFTHGEGIFTGMVGSLGYWLEQQGVRRGSQPQYYYVFLQMPVYEYMPLILASLAGVAGLGRLFGWRQYSLQAEAESQIKDEIDAGSSDHDTLPPRRSDATARLDMDKIMREQPALEALRLSHQQKSRDAGETSPSPFWSRPYDHQDELMMRRARREWLGDVPFLQFVGYWAVIMTAALTIAGEKMPWLTTHITLPLILIGGWYAGTIIEKISWTALRRGGWALLLFLVPVFLVALASVLSPLMGGNAPFQGQNQQSLSTTNTWIAAVIVLLGSGYFIVRLARDIGITQARRLTFASVVFVLGLLTVRTSVMAAFHNYDYATEFLVYAHSGPAVKTVLEQIDYFADRTNEGENMRVAYDDDSSWPMTWYMRHYNSSFFAGDPEALEANPSPIEGARVVVVGSRKNAAVERILGDDYYRFDFIRLWWPMQEYFNLNFDRVANVFQLEADNPAAPLYRQGIWDIWWDRDYDAYAEAQCIEGRLPSCNSDANPGACFQQIENECSADSRYDVNRWPVSDRMYVYVDKEIAAQIWDAGIGGENVAAREPQNAVDRVYSELDPLTTFGGSENMSHPRGIAVAPDGTVYVADTDGSRILVFDPSGAFVQQIGVPATSSENVPAGALFQPWGVAVGADGNLYVADTWNHRVQVFSPEGEPLHMWGQYGVPDDTDNLYALFGPRAIAVDTAGNVLVVDTGGKRIRVYSPEGEWLRDIGSGGVGLGQLDEPVGIAVNPINGDIYVADTWNRRIQVFSAAGVALRAWEVPMWYDNRTSPDRPYLAVSPDGTLIAVSDMNAVERNDGPRVVVYDLTGNVIYAFNAPETDFAAGLHGIRVVAGLAFAPDGSLYVLDADTNRVVKFPPLPVASGFQPSPPDSGAGAGAEAPVGEAVSPEEDLPFSMDEPLTDDSGSDSGDDDTVEDATEESDSTDVQPTEAATEEPESSAE